MAEKDDVLARSANPNEGVHDEVDVLPITVTVTI